MFESLAQRFSRLFSSLGTGRLTERGIREGIAEVRRALLEADVNLHVVEVFMDRVQAAAVGLESLKGTRPADQFVKVVHDELVALLGSEAPRIAWSSKGPTAVMVVGLQGSGKTTTTAKLARHFAKREQKRPLLVAADVQRPAAVEQLQTLGRALDIPVHAEPTGRPPRICRRGVERAADLGCDLVLLDTAGRLHIDEELMDELEDIRAAIRPTEIWLVLDNMLGQDAVKSAGAFDRRLDLTGIILTKTDGDARGGVALSVREVTGKPIRFVGTGENLDALEAFHPDRAARRILGLGDVLSVVERAQEVVEQERAQAAAERLFLDRFTLDDLRFQLDAMRKMGGMKSLLSKLPGGAAVDESQLDDLPNDDQVGHYIAVVQSMTPGERSDPRTIHMQRRHRIARGSGTSLNTVGTVLKMHREMRDGMKRMRKEGGPLARLALRGLENQKKKRLKRFKKEGLDFGRWFGP